jgi:hypothetical protein
MAIYVRLIIFRIGVNIVKQLFGMFAVKHLGFGLAFLYVPQMDHRIIGFDDFEFVQTVVGAQYIGKKIERFLRCAVVRAGVRNQADLQPIKKRILQLQCSFLPQNDWNGSNSAASGGQFRPGHQMPNEWRTAPSAGMMDAGERGNVHGRSMGGRRL